MDSGLYYGRPRFLSGLRDTLGVTQLKQEDEHDLSHRVFYHKNGYSLFRATGRKSCKNASYTPLKGEKVENFGGGMDRKNAADFLLGQQPRV